MAAAPQQNQSEHAQHGSDRNAEGSLRIVDAVLSLPLIVIAVTVLVALGHSTLTVIVVIGLVFAPIVSRTVRAAVLAERQLDYVSASRLQGERAPYVMFVEILPNVFGPIVVEATVRQPGGGVPDPVSRK